jgi:integrase
LGGLPKTDPSHGGGIAKTGGSGRGINRLTDRSVKAWLVKRKAGTAETKILSDGGGLALHVTPAGTAVWRIKYRFGGKEKEHAAGVYPDVSLEEARAARATLKEQKRTGLNPAAELRKAKATATLAANNSVQAVAEAWLAKQRPDWSRIHYAKSRRALERDIFPTLGSLPVADVTPGMIGAAITRVIDRGVRETASRLLEHVGSVFEYAQAIDLRADNPAAPVRQLLPKRRPVESHPALLDIAALREVLRRCDVLPIPLSRAVWHANRLLAFTGARPGNVIEARWSQFELDADAPVWTIARSEMKKKDPTRGDFVLFLGPTIAAELRAWREMTGGTGYCFVSPTGKRPHIAIATLDKLYSRTLNLAGKHSPHGWRSSLRTLATESRQFDHLVLKAALDHRTGNAVEQAYNRAQWIAERRRLAAWWDARLTGEPA